LFSIIFSGKITLINRLARPWLLINSIYKLTESATEERNQKERLVSFTRSLIQNHRVAAFKSPRVCLLDYLIQISEKHSDFTDDDIIDEGKLEQVPSFTTTT